MADLLALSWDRRRLCGMEVSLGGANPRILGGFSVEWPEQPPTSAWLRETLRRHGVNARQVVLALPREDTVLRLLELPAVSDDEMPTLVRFQAAARSAQSLDQLLLDYLPLPLREGVAQKEVWLTTTLLATVDPIRALITEAGLDLVQITVSSLCLTELIARGEMRQSFSGPDKTGTGTSRPNDLPQVLRGRSEPVPVLSGSIGETGASLVVLRDGARMELAVVCQRQLIAAHAVKWSSENEIPPVSKMLAEVSRVLVQVQAWLPEGTLQRAWVIGDDSDVGELPEAIGQRWNCPVQRFDPWRDAGISLGSAKLDGRSSDYAIVAGLALIQAGALTPKIDLLHPRQPPPKRDPRKVYIAAVAAAGLMITALGTGIIQQSLGSYQRAVEELTKEDRKLDQDLKAGDTTFVAAKEIGDWQTRNIDQLTQIAELYQVMNGTEREIVSEYKFNVGSGNVLAKIGVVGNARERIDAEQLAQSLTDLQKYVVRPSSVTTTLRDPNYGQHFDFDMDLVPVREKLAIPGKTVSEGLRK